MFFKSFLPALFTLCALTALSQDKGIVKTRQDSINAIVTVLQQDNSIIFPGSIKTLRSLRQYHRFWFFDKLCTNDELAKYSIGNNSCLRVYSLAALMHRNYKDYNLLSKKLLSDTGQILINKGDFFSPATVSEFIKTKNFIRLAIDRDTSYMTQSLDYKEYRDAYFRFLVSWPDDILRTRQDSIKVLLTAIRKYNHFDPHFTGIVGLPAEQYYTFKFLEVISTDVQLQALTSDSVPCLRVYSFIALAHRKYKQIDSIRNILLSDTSKLFQTRSCITKETTVSALIKEKDIERTFLDNEDDNYWRQLGIDPAYRAVYFKELVGMAN